MTTTTRFPLDRQARLDYRNEIRNQALEQAARTGLSAKCAASEHVQLPGGCTDDGSGCICACHEDWRCSYCRAETPVGRTVCPRCADVP